MVQQFSTSELLPKTGMLSFFYDADDQPWGMRPEDGLAWKVFYFEDSASLSKAQVPVLDPIWDEFSLSTFSPCSLQFEETSTFPDWNSAEIRALNLPAIHFEKYKEFVRGWNYDSNRVPSHRLLGHPQLIQGDFWDECLPVSTDENNDLLATAKNAADWRLLFQIDSDDLPNMMWGDSGRLYFCIRQSDLLAADFNRVWLIFQCF